MPSSHCAAAARVLLVVLGVFYVSAAAAQAESSDVTYRWVYRNPLSILASDADDEDLGEGSYFGTRNSVNNTVEDTSQLALAYNHGATLAFLPNGSLATIWQASIQWWEGSSGQSAFWSLSNDYGDTWGPPVELFSNTSGGGGPIWGPQIHVHNDTLFMFYSSTAPALCEQNAGPGGGTQWPPGGSLMFITSTNNGETWGPPQTILSAEEDGGVAKLNVARVTVTASGDWLLPFWREASGPSLGKCWGDAGISFHGIPGVFKSSDQGVSWQETVHRISPAAGTPRSKWLIENAIAPFTNQQTNQSGLLQVFRDDTGTVWQSTSMDNGTTWTDATPGQLPSPDSKTDLWPFSSGRVLAAFNNVTDQSRQNLSLAVTPDGGATWQHMALIEGNTTYAPHTGAFSYPTVLYIPQVNRVMVVYSVGYPGSTAAALLAGSTAASPGFYVPHGRRAQSPRPRLPGQQAGQEGTPLSPGPSPSAGRSFGHGLRRRLGEGVASHSRRLHQVPFDYGAWNIISYGIRMAFLDADTVLQEAVPDNAAPQQRPRLPAIVEG